MACQWPHIQVPCVIVAVCARRQDLQAAEFVEEEGDGAEVGVGAEGGTTVRGGLGRGADETDLVPRYGGEAVEIGEGAWWEVEAVVEAVEEEGYDGVGVVDEG